MLTKRIIPVLTVKDGTLVKTTKFDKENARPVSSPISATQIFEGRGVDELILIDIDTDKPNFKLLEKFVECCFMPLTIGGGIRTIEDITQLLRAGADKVAIKTKLQDREFIREAVDRFGSQCLVAVIDYFDNPMRHAIYYEDWGVGEILLQAINRDGTMSGYDLPAIYGLSKVLKIPIIACGGCGSPDDALKAIEAGADAVAASSMYLFKNITPQDVNNYLFEHNINVRR